MESGKAPEAVFSVLRAGIRWNAIPKGKGSSGAARRYFRFWRGAGFFEALRKTGLEKYDEVKGIQRKRPSADGRVTKAPPARGFRRPRRWPGPDGMMFPNSGGFSIRLS